MLRTKQEFDLFRKDVKEALTDIEKKYGVEINCGSISYSAMDFNMKLQASYGSQEEAKRKEFEILCLAYGLEKEDFKKEFVLGKDSYVIEGIERKRRKYPILVTKNGGEQVLLTIDSTKKGLGRN